MRVATGSGRALQMLADDVADAVVSHAPETGTGAVAILRARGYRARAIEQGVPEWRAQGGRTAAANGRRQSARP